MMARKRGKREAPGKGRGLGRRIMSAFLATVMCVSLVQVSILAAPSDADKAAQAKAQIEGGAAPVYYTYDAEKGTFSKTENTGAEVKNNASDPKVTISKEIKATGVENEFDITLTVETNEAIESTTKSPDAAVVLVIDTSDSMRACATCGNYSVWTDGSHGREGYYTYYHAKDCKYSTSKQDWTDVVATQHTRLKAAKDEAVAFLRSYVGFSTDENGVETYKDPNAFRYAAVVEFNGNATTPQGWIQLHGATQAETEANLTTINGKINSLGTDYSTNPDAGLQLAQGLLGSSVISGVDNKFLVLLTDGEPNANTGELRGYTVPSGYTLRNDRDYDNPARRANYIRSTLDTTFYSVCFGAGTDVFNWMGSFSNKCVNAESASDLHLAFQEIIIRLRLAVDAWKVTDSMGQHISLKSVDTTDHANNAVTQNGSTLNWDLRKDLTSAATKIVDADGKPVASYTPGMNCTITYSLAYTVKLDVAGIINDADDNDAAKAALEEYYLTNGETRLDYYLTKTENGNTVYVDDNGTQIADGQEKLLKLYFKVPAVKGYCAELEFTKVNPKGEKLANASFTLANKAGTWSDSAVSDANGKVTFTKLIPSGDTYVLTETKAPEGYETVEPVEFTVSYGNGVPTFEKGKLVDPVKIAYTDVTFTKTWLTPNGVTPDAITVTLKQNGEVYKDETGKPYENLTIRKADCAIDGLTGVWSYTFEDLPETDDQGNAYTYTVEEADMDGYEVEGNGTLALTNTATGTVDIIVAKDWLLPETMNTTSTTVDIILLANGKEAARRENVADGASAQFINMPKYDNGQTILYTVAEESDGLYQQVEIRKDVEAGPTTMYTIVNTVAEEHDASVSGEKIWKDNGDIAARPESITVELYADGKATGKTLDVTAADNWRYTFTGLQRYNFVKDASNKIINVYEIAYTVKEVGEVEGYVSSAVGTDVINTRSEKVDFTVTKKWAADLAGAEHGSITAILYANGHPVKEAAFTESYTFTGLDKYDMEGVAIKYDVIERPVDGYTARYSDVTTDAEGNYAQTITNRRDDAEDTITVTVTKIWKQPGDASDKTATFQLYNGKEPIEGKIINITGNGVGYFTNLDRYEEVDGKLVEIDYNVEEINIPSAYKLTYENEQPADSSGNFTCNFINTITGVTDVSVTKEWKKPSSVKAPDISVSVQSYDFNEGDWVDLKETIVIKSGESYGELRNLPKYDGDGRRISYRITELSVPGYSSAVSGGYDAGTGDYTYGIVNSINPANTTATVSKTWIDGNTDPADRPSVTLQLLQSGLEYETVEFWYDADSGKVMATTKYDTVEAAVSEDGNTYTAGVSVPVYSKDLSMKYSYTVAEWNTPAGYSSTVTGTAATNKRVGTLEPLTITKYWTDPGVEDRPDITLVLTGTDGSVRKILVTDDNGVSAVLNRQDLAVTASGNTWSIVVSGLPEFDADGAKITYTLSEEAVSGYTAKAVEGQPFAIRNVIDQVSDVSVGAEKVWANMDAEGVYTPKYPDSITVALFRDGVMVEGSKQEVKRGEGDVYTIQRYTDLDKYADDGHVYKYEVLELKADGSSVKDGGVISFGENNDYTVTYEDGVITNTYNVPAKYLWILETNYVHKDYDGTVISTHSLTSDVKTETESKTVTADPDKYKVCEKDGLTYSYDTAKENVTSVELVKENHLYKLVLNYILVEKAPENPTPPPGGGDDDITVTVKKVWKGDEEENRPESITVQLLCNGEKYDTQELSADNSWKYRWLDLDDGKNWTVEEVDVPEGYVSDVTNKGNAWTITNTLDDGTTIPEEPVPGGGQPGGGDGPDDIIIPDPPVPTGGQPGDPGKTTTPAKTGDFMTVWAAAAAASGMSLGYLALTGKKREDEE